LFGYLSTEHTIANGVVTLVFERGQKEILRTRSSIVEAVAECHQILLPVAKWCGVCRNRHYGLLSQPAGRNMLSLYLTNLRAQRRLCRYFTVHPLGALASTLGLINDLRTFVGTAQSYYSWFYASVVPQSERCHDTFQSVLGDQSNQLPVVIIGFACAILSFFVILADVFGWKL
jgi:hypothetical protein